MAAGILMPTVFPPKKLFSGEHLHITSGNLPQLVLIGNKDANSQYLGNTDRGGIFRILRFGLGTGEKKICHAGRACYAMPEKSGGQRHGHHVREQESTAQSTA